MTAHQHDPGGKVRLALMEGVRGDAVFSEDGRYRTLMRRWLGDAFPARSHGRSVAQPGRALRSGRRGRRFESSHSDHFFQ